MSVIVRIASAFGFTGGRRANDLPLANAHGGLALDLQGAGGVDGVGQG